jgi:hypothetical protein
MTALDEYEEVRHGEHDHDSLCTAADAAIESLKCCGACSHISLEHYSGGDFAPCKYNRGVVDFSGHCHFTPSRWQERTP